MSLLLQIYHFGMIGRDEMKYKKQLRGRKGKGELFDLVLHAGVRWTIIYSNSSVPQYILQNCLASLLQKYKCQARTGKSLITFSGNFGILFHFYFIHSVISISFLFLFLPPVQ